MKRPMTVLVTGAVRRLPQAEQNCGEEQDKDATGKNARFHVAPYRCGPAENGASSAVAWNRTFSGFGPRFHGERPFTPIVRACPLRVPARTIVDGLSICLCVCVVCACV